MKRKEHLHTKRTLRKLLLPPKGRYMASYPLYHWLLPGFPCWSIHYKLKQLLTKWKW